MLMKRKPKPEITPADSERQRLHTELLYAQRDLGEKVELAIVRHGVIDLYPDGPDKERAVQDFNAAKYSLLCAIGTVDGLRNDLRRYIEAHKDEFVDTASWVIPSKDYTSHSIIEDAYKRFFKTR